LVCLTLIQFQRDVPEIHISDRFPQLAMTSSADHMLDENARKRKLADEGHGEHHAKRPKADKDAKSGNSSHLKPLKNYQVILTDIEGALGFG